MGFFQEIREFAHRYDPIGANLTDNAIRTSSRVTAEGSRFLDNTFFGGSSAMGRFTRDEARKNIADPARAVSRAAATIALMYGFGAFSGGEAAAAGGAAGGGTAAGGGSAAGGYSAAPWASSPEFVAAETGSAYGTYGASAAPWAGESTLLGAGGAAAAGGSASGGTSGGAPSASQPAAQSSPYGQAARSIATGVGTNVATSLLTPKPKGPEKEPVVAMPDPEAQDRARRRRLASQRSRQGRAASIMTSY